MLHFIKNNSYTQDITKACTAFESRNRKQKTLIGNTWLKVSHKVTKGIYLT